LTVALILIVAQIVGILAAVIASVIQIESILVSGPLVSLVGLLISLVSFRRNDGVGLLFGLSTPSVAVLCFSIIFGMNWGPKEAAFPISCLLVAFAVLSVPAGVVALRRLRRPAGERRRLKMQFQISTLLGLTFLVALVLGLHKTFAEPGAAMGIVIMYSTAVAIVIKRFRDGMPATGSLEEASIVGSPDSDT
jgi:hypothetical protein